MTAPSPHTAHYQLRSDLRAALRKDLLGPHGGEEETLTDDAPITAYPIGVLFPQASAGDDGTQPSLSLGDEDGVDTPPDVVLGDDAEQGASDLGIALANLRKPSSMGLTFAVDPAVSPQVTVTVTAARYVPEDEAGRRIEPRRSEARSTERQKERWRREPLACEPGRIDVRWPGSVKGLSCEGLEWRALVRPAVEGTVTVTVTVVNTLTAGEFDLQDAYCFFQPEVSVHGEEGTRPFVQRPARLGAADDEQALSRLLNRHAPVFATGHGTSVAWKWQASPLRTPMPDRAAVASVRTEFVPTHEVLLTDSNPHIDDRALTMHGLGHGSREDVVAALTRLLKGYEEWIEAREEEALTLAGTAHEASARRQLELCRLALGRMRRGVALLADERQPNVLAAFRWANQAMAQQRARTAWIKEGRSGEPQVDKGKWRPFQIAFMLLCLEGIVNPNHEDREVADLLWFPTGGGKTEAYLGLIAFTTFWRRLRDGARGHGVTVVMRYTLRLLTLQQFERAAALICAMERVRAEHETQLGTEPVSLGMWVGKSATPNDLESAQDRLDKLRREPGKSLQKENPVQLQACPWCGEPLTAFDYEVRESAHRMIVRCPSTSCAFNTDDGLPVHLVDEAVYDAHPTLVIATVDKFASMPWRPATAALFNRDEPGGPRPPELIVQDELHLISGPLGTLTGLYETAVDVLADRPKVVASTATIRRATEQVGALFDRRTAQFPPAGLDARDSWFAVETPREDKASRRYIGLLTPSTSQATLLVRTYAALLDAAARTDAEDEVKDAYWTLVGYFNSLRLLSAAELQVLDDVQDRLELLGTRAAAAPRTAAQLIELSSRADSSAVPRHLRQLGRQLPDPDTLDVLLATNMISVGVDIDRLGLMAVMGQPQTTAEYIQATSRVGRRHPGLVAVMYNSARSRDRSHYESFPSFHSALYREVESTSVTPFSSRARDRGLHAVVVALTRLMLPAARPNEAAAHIAGFIDDVNALVRPCVLARVDKVNDLERKATAQSFDQFVRWWLAEAADNPELVYEARRGSHQPALLAGFDDEDTETAGWSTLWSLRDVDAESTLFLER
ncbi:DNA helicase [Streptomyces sp. G3]|uniref:helicase-related protein n=1 Tax=Streptomyces sp. G3 TaxID=690144 RepID=UPI00202FED8D|nr:helicase-related protein [Streptomyces sp. G3]MCM1937271.1 DNA helicase [Streptomyces sp. G3]